MHGMLLEEPKRFVKARRGQHHVALVVCPGLMNMVQEQARFKERFPNFGKWERDLRPDEIKRLVGVVRFVAPILVRQDAAVALRTLSCLCERLDMSEIVPRVDVAGWDHEIPRFDDPDHLHEMIGEMEFVLRVAPARLSVLAITQDYWPAFFGGTVA